MGAEADPFLDIDEWRQRLRCACVSRTSRPMNALEPLDLVCRSLPFSVAEECLRRRAGALED